MEDYKITFVVFVKDAANAEAAYSYAANAVEGFPDRKHVLEDGLAASFERIATKNL